MPFHNCSILRLSIYLSIFLLVRPSVRARLRGLIYFHVRDVTYCMLRSLMQGSSRPSPVSISQGQEEGCICREMNRVRPLNITNWRIFSTRSELSYATATIIMQEMHKAQQNTEHTTLAKQTVEPKGNAMWLCILP